MLPDRRKLPAFHENDLDKILLKFNLLEPLRQGNLVCSICKITLTRSNFGCIFIDQNGDIQTACSKPECLEKVSKEMQNVSS